MSIDGGDEEMVLTNEEVRILEQYRYMVAERDAIERQINRLKIPDGPAGITSSPMGEKMPSTNEKVIAAIQHLEGMEEMLLKKLAAIAEMASGFEGVLERFESAKTRSVLRYYYGLGWTDDRIGAKLSMSRRTVYNIRADAVGRNRITEGA